MDTIGRFIGECCEVGPTFQEPTGKLYLAYENWCGQTGEQTETKKAFGMALARLDGLQRGKDSKFGWYWTGIRLLAVPTDATPC